MVTVLQERAEQRDLERGPARKICVAGRTLTVTPVFDTYWRFAAARQGVYEARLAGGAGPFTDDPILQRYRFTNCFRAADRVSQDLIGGVIYRGEQTWEEVFFRTLLFKIFNKTSTWRLLNTALGEVRWDTYDYRAFDRVLSTAFTAGQRLYSAAYIVPPPQLGQQRKHQNHLRLLEMMMTANAPQRVLSAPTLQDAYQVLLRFPAIGPFLAYQFVIDLNYAAEMPFSEMDFVVPGPGARDGIRKCFGPAADGIEADVIRYMADTQDEHFTRLGLSFAGLRGRPLQLIDCQNLFCEVDKYARVAHPDIAGISGRSRIKQTYRQQADAMPAWFPPKWQLNGPAGQ
jgi:hypothetical protein